MDLAWRTAEDEIAALRHELAAARAQLGTAAVEIEHLRAQLAALRRQQYGQSSERLDAEVAQLELRLEDLEETEAEHQAARPDPASPAAPSHARARTHPYASQNASTPPITWGNWIHPVSGSENIRRIA